MHCQGGKLMVQVTSRVPGVTSLWLGGRESNPDSQIQSLESYHWTTSHQEQINLRVPQLSTALSGEVRYVARSIVRPFRFDRLIHPVRLVPARARAVGVSPRLPRRHSS